MMDKVCVNRAQAPRTVPHLLAIMMMTVATTVIRSKTINAFVVPSFTSPLSVSRNVVAPGIVAKRIAAQRWNRCRSQDISGHRGKEERRRQGSIILRAGPSIGRNDTSITDTYDRWLDDSFLAAVVDDTIEKSASSISVAVREKTDEVADAAAVAAAATKAKHELDAFVNVTNDYCSFDSGVEGSDFLKDSVTGNDVNDVTSRLAAPDSDSSVLKPRIGVFFDEIEEEEVVGSGGGKTKQGVFYDEIEEVEVVERNSVARTDYEVDGAPQVGQILRFAAGAIGVWLCGPILSMIDTSAVGLLAGTAQQAALNPAVSVTDHGGLIVAFMYTATTNLVAAAQQSDRLDSSKPRTTRTVISAMRLALIVGAGFGLALCLSGRFLLRTLIGNDSLDPAVFAAALRYVRIRALGMPAAVVIGTAQSACLGMQDLKSPLYVLVAAAVINFLGDAIFVRNSSLWIGGAAGAAWATVLSQYAALAMFVRWFRTKPTASRRLSARTRAAQAAEAMSDGMDEKSEADVENAIRPHPPSRGFLSCRFNFLDLFRRPQMDIVKEFVPYVGPVTATSIGRISGFLAMSHVASSALGTVDMAAQQIILSFFCCLCPVSDSLNLTAQSFIPQIFARPLGKARADALRNAMKSFVRAGWIIGAALVAMVATIPFLGRLFTADSVVLAQVTTAVPGLALFFALSGIIMVGEGLFLGQRDLKFLGKVYAAFFFAVPAVLLRLKRRALTGLQEVGVGTMWTTFSLYQVVRFFIWIYRMKWLQQQRDNEATHASINGL